MGKLGGGVDKRGGGVSKRGGGVGKLGGGVGKLSDLYLYTAYAAHYVYFTISWTAQPMGLVGL